MGFDLEIDGQCGAVEILARRPDLVLLVGGRVHVVRGATTQVPAPGAARLEIDGTAFDVVRAPTAQGVMLRHRGRTFEAVLRDKLAAADEAAAGHDRITAPMPGTVITLHKTPGDAVIRGETLVTIESMKLQTALTAPRDGVVARLNLAQGATFERGAVLAELEPAAKPAGAS